MLDFFATQGCILLRIQPIESAAQAETYYSKSDAGYYEKPDDLRCAWVGKGAELLGLEGPPDYEQFKRLIHGLDPWSGRQLTSKLLDNRLAGWDVNIHCPKGVTTVIEQGDDRVQDALWEAARETVADLERYATTRVRKGGRQEDRVTGNLVGYAVEHAETRPAKDDKMPDPHRHIHMVIANLTFDKAEGEWKAVKFRPIMDLRKYFDRRFNQRFASKLAGLGYEIKTNWERDDKGHRKYMGWDVKGVPESVVKKFSRRSDEILKLAEELEETTDDNVWHPSYYDKLGAASRLKKRDDLTLDECRQYWNSRLTPAEARQIEDTIEQARLGLNPRPEPAAEQAMEYSLAHHFSRHSVVPVTSLEITSMERSMGRALPEDIEREGKKQGLLVRRGEATTKEVLAEERRIIDYARNGRGTVRPLAAGVEVPGLAKLSRDQQAVCRHIWRSSDKVMLIRGGAGTGKSTAARTAADGIEAAGKRVYAFALSSDASRDNLRRGGFKDADTIKRLLDDKNLQEEVRGQVIFLDEGSQVGSKMLRQAFDLADELGARVVIFGDQRQHGSVERGTTMQVLEEYAGLPVSELTEIRRQTHTEYKQAVAAIMKGDILAGHDILAKLGWIQQTPVFDHNKPLVDDYLEAVQTPKANGEMTTALVIAPTNIQGDAITSNIRQRLKEQELIGEKDEVFPTLKPLHWTEAERSDRGQYAGANVVVQFHRASGPFKAGQRVTASDLLAAKNYKLRGEHFSVYAPGEIGVSTGDVIRATANVFTKDKKHRFDNGAVQTVTGFTKAGDIRLANGWVLDKNVAHIKFGYVTTSFASQSRTCDRVFIAMGQESLPAMSAAQYYVSVSRGRSMAKIYSGLTPMTLREAITKIERRKSATELMAVPKPSWRLAQRAMAFMRSVRDKYRQWQEKAQHAIDLAVPQREVSYGR